MQHNKRTYLWTGGGQNKTNVLFPYFGRITAIAMGPDQPGKSRRRLRGGVGIEGARTVATEGLGVRPASVYG